MRAAAISRRAAIVAALGAGAVLFGVLQDKTDFRQRMTTRASAITGGNPARGEDHFIGYGCGGCHALSGVPKAVGGVGPRLDEIAVQAVIAGRLGNSPDNMRRWIRDPQGVSPGTAMPNLGVSDRDARDITAFLYSRTK